jgi:perosamine synthetase
MKVPVCEPMLNGKEKEFLLNCIESGWISSDGPCVKEFEAKFSNYIGSTHGIAVCNGTAALSAAIFALDIRNGDEVIMPSFTIISCAISVIKFGGIPVLVDIEPETWNMDITQVESKITNKTKAIMAVHMYGHPVDIDPLLVLAKKYNLYVIEDASQVHGAEYKGNKCGSLADISTFSFYANKILTTGEGGMVLTSNSTLADRARNYRNLCFDAERKFIHKELGDNLRITSMQAAVGLAQLERIDEFVKIKRDNGKKYAERLADIPNLKIQIEKPWAKMVYWMYCVQLSPDSGYVADGIREKLAENGIATRAFFRGMHQQPALLEAGLFKNSSYPVTEIAYQNGFYLPSSLSLTDSQIDYVVDHLKKLVV